MTPKKTKADMESEIFRLEAKVRRVEGELELKERELKKLKDKLDEHEEKEEVRVWVSLNLKMTRKEAKNLQSNIVRDWALEEVIDKDGDPPFAVVVKDVHPAYQSFRTYDDFGSPVSHIHDDTIDRSRPREEIINSINDGKVIGDDGKVIGEQG